MEFLTQQFVPIMFAGLLVLLLTGFPVAFALAATGLGFGFIGMEIGLFPSSLFQALPLRIFGIMQNESGRRPTGQSSSGRGRVTRQAQRLLSRRTSKTRTPS